MARLDRDTAYIAGRIEQYQAGLLKATEAASQAQVLAVYEEANRQIVNELARLFALHAKDGKLTLSEMQRYSRLQKLNAIVGDIGRSLGGSTTKFLRSELPALYESNAIQLCDALDVSFVGIDPRRIEAVMAYPWSGAEFSERVWDDTAALTTRLKQTLVRGFVRGTSFRDMSAEIVKHMDSGQYAAKRLIRTEAMAMMNQSSLDSYKVLGADRIQWLATWDERTCSICGSHDGEEYALGDEPTLPAHPLCRCTFVPVAASDVATWQSRTAR